jgi:serine/threonine protein kinase
LPNVAEVTDFGADVGVVRRLSVGSVPTYLERVLTPEGQPHFIVVERFARDLWTTDDEAEQWIHEARLALDLEHENVLRARAIVVGKTEIGIACDLVDGERLSELGPVTIEMSLRILIDALTGLAVIHKLRDPSGAHRLKVVHGEVTPANIHVGRDGISRLLRTCRVRAPGAPSPSDVRFVAPEILTQGHVDQRSDVFSAGALLLQALDGVNFADAPWAVPLADVAAHALDAAPEKRFPTATAMVTELRRIAGDRLATASDVASFVEVQAGAKIASRRGIVYASETRIKTTPPSPEPASEVEEPPSLVEDAPSPVFEAASSPVFEEAPPHVFEEVSSPVVEEAPSPVVEEAPSPVVEEVSSPGAEDAHGSHAISSITRTLPPPEFEADQNLLAAGFVELDENDLTTLPPSMPPAQQQVRLPPIPRPPSLGRWANLMSADPSTFSLPPVTDVTLPPSPRLPRPKAKPRRAKRSLLRVQGASLGNVASAAIGASMACGVLYAFGGPSQPSNVATPAPAAIVVPKIVEPPPAPKSELAAFVNRPKEAPRDKIAMKPDRPTAALPEVSAPEVSAPQVSAPEVSASKVAAPQVAAPKAGPLAHAPRPAPKEHPRTEPEPAPPVAPVAPSPSFAGVDAGGEFDRNAAMQVLREAGDRSRVCMAHVAAPGAVRVAVTFARTGSVASAVVEGALAGTAPAACVEGKFRPLRIPPFRGSSLTVRKTISF